MAFFEAYRQERAKLSTRESVETLSYIEEYFLDGKNWAQGVYQGAGNTRCLVGAAEHCRSCSIDDAKHWLRQAIAERTGGAIATIEEFNDSQSYEEVAAVISRAKQLALTTYSPAQLPVPVARVAPVEIIPPVRSASPSWDASAPVIPQPNPWADHEPMSHEEPKSESSLRHKLADWWD
jgi:hypothetical protein